MITRDSFRSLKLRRQPVEIPDLGTVHVQEFTAAQLGEYVKRHQAGTGELDLMVYAVASTTIDDNGQPIFTEADAEEIKKLSLAVVKQLAEAALNVSGLADVKKNVPTSTSESDSVSA